MHAAAESYSISQRCLVAVESPWKIGKEGEWLYGKASNVCGVVAQHIWGVWKTWSKHDFPPQNRTKRTVINLGKEGKESVSKIAKLFVTSGLRPRMTVFSIPLRILVQRMGREGLMSHTLYTDGGEGKGKGGFLPVSHSSRNTVQKDIHCVEGDGTPLMTIHYW